MSKGRREDLRDVEHKYTEQQSSSCPDAHPPDPTPWGPPPSHTGRGLVCVTHSVWHGGGGHLQDRVIRRQILSGALLPTSGKAAPRFQTLRNRDQCLLL